MTDRLASLAMYVGPPPVARATARLWAHLAGALRRAGMRDVPDRLDEAVPHEDAWVDPGLLLGQACGYPYVTRLRGRVRLVATPAYGLPGCDGPDMCSFIVVRRDADVGTIAGLRGLRAAINAPGSNSGANLFRASVAPFSTDGRFFSSVTETGSHAASIAAVAGGSADVAAIDCVTYGNIARFDPEQLSGIRILSETAKGPGLPFVTRATASDAEVSMLRRALRDAIADPSLSQVRDTLSLRDVVVLEDADYEPLAELERHARRHAYPVIA